MASYVGPAGRERLAKAAPSSLLARMFVSGLRKRIRSDEYVWTNWTRVAEAIEWAAEHGEWLGLHMA